MTGGRDGALPDWPRLLLSGEGTQGKRRGVSQGVEGPKRCDFPEVGKDVCTWECWNTELAHSQKLHHRAP